MMGLISVDLSATLSSMSFANSTLNRFYKRFNSSERALTSTSLALTFVILKTLTKMCWDDP